LKIKEKEKRRKSLEKNNPDKAGKYTKAVASEKLKQLTKTGKVSLLKVRGVEKIAGGACGERWVAARC
jgi:U3 small nucleolar RNA-associated protein MPP10